MLRRVMLPCALMALVGCDEWPRFAHLPSADGDYPGDVDPASLVSVDWVRLDTEAPDARNALPTQADVHVLQLEVGQGRILTGGLKGTGWSNDLVPEEISSSSCRDAIGVRTAIPEGDYLHDVDFARVQGPLGATLCARLNLTSGAQQIGWDLVPFESDECGIPSGLPLDAEGEVVGLDQGGHVGGWGLRLDHPRHSVLLAAYFPNDAELLVGYTLGLSVVPSHPDGSPGLCPLLPDEIKGPN